MVDAAGPNPVGLSLLVSTWLKNLSPKRSPQYFMRSSMNTSWSTGSEKPIVANDAPGCSAANAFIVR